MTINQRLSQLLKENELSSEQLARGLGVSGSMVRRWRKHAALKLAHIIALARYFDCSLDFICGRTNMEGKFNPHDPVMFATRLGQLLASGDANTRQIAQKSLLGRRNFYEWLSGKPPLSSSLIALADQFDCTIDYLVGLE